VADVLTDPFAVAAIVLAVAGVAKLRAPRVAVAALREAGLPASTWLIRAFACFEVALGVWSIVSPGRSAAILLACCYAAFAGLGMLLARRRSSCGCFGESEAPASMAQAVISAVLAAICVLAAVHTPHGAGWLLDRPVNYAVVLVIGIAGSAYATVLAYTQLPGAWGAWSAR
jgi:hypothetical protein